MPQSATVSWRGTQLGFGLCEVAAQVLRVAIPQLDATDPEDRALTMSFRPLDVPSVDRFVEIGKREQDRGDHHHQAVTSGRLPPSSAFRASAHTRSAGPPERVQCQARRRRGPDTEAVGGVHVSVGEHSLELVSIGLGSKAQREELHRLETPSEVIELGGQLSAASPAIAPPRSGARRKMSVAPEVVGRVAPQAGITCELVCAAADGR